jgi:hypothetical protein
MRRFLYVLGILALFAIIAAGVGFGVMLYNGHMLDAESKAIVDSAVPAIAASRSSEQLIERATPDPVGWVERSDTHRVVASPSGMPA